MAKLLVVESSEEVRKKYNELLEKQIDFDYDIALSYDEADYFLKRKRYEFAVTDIDVHGAKEGVIISLLNRHNLAPIIFTDQIDEGFLEAYESAQIADYVLKGNDKNILSVLEKLKQLKGNKKRTILVVDDSILHADFIKQNLIMHRFKVLTATNGLLALERLENHPEIDCIVTNHRMKVMDGLELTQRIRQQGRQELPILALTSESEAASSFLQEGASDYLCKPFSKDEFYERVYQNIATLETL